MRRLIQVMLAGSLIASAEVTITTTDSLSLSKDVYASILFTVADNKATGVPAAYSFKESGDVPPGMRFESYPCNKPGRSPCPTIARADSVFLDGVPSLPGSYTMVITATDPKGNSTHQSFTIKVSNRK